MKIDRVRSCCSKTAEENAIKTSCISQQQNSIYIKWISWVTWTRFENAAVFFSRKFNIWSFFSTSCDYVIFSLIMQSDVARGQLCEIAPVHIIRSPVQTMKFDRNQRFLLRYWMQTFEQITDWQNSSFIDALFIDLKMLQFFKVIIPEGTINSLMQSPKC